MYKIEQKRAEKMLLISFDGFPSTEETMVFVEDYMKNVASINAKDYSLVLDGKKLSPLKQEALPNLEQSYLAYMNEGYKNIIIITPESAITKMQLERVAKKVSFPVSYASSIEEAKVLSKRN